MNQYQDEARTNWGNTQAYQESEDKTAHYSQDQWDQINKEMDAIMMTFARYSKEGLVPSSLPVQELVSQWQCFLTRYYYDCTKEILAVLGRMYVADERFKENIDRYGGGTAELLSASIEIFCQEKQCLCNNINILFVAILTAQG